MTVIGEQLREALERAAREDYRRLHGAEIAANINGPLIDVERAAAVAESTILRAPRAPWMLIMAGDPPSDEVRAELGRRAGAAGAVAVAWMEGAPNPVIYTDRQLAEIGLVRIDRVRAIRDTSLGDTFVEPPEAEPAVLALFDAIDVYDASREG